MNFLNRTKFWKKYHNYDFFDLKEIVMETIKNLNTINSSLFQRAIQHKKIKIF